MRSTIFAYIQILVMAAALWSCTQTELPEQASSDKVFNPSKEDYISSEKAADYACHYIQELKGATRSDLKISSVKLYLSINSTRAEDTEGNPFYIVNCEDESGFAVIAAKECENPLYAVSDEGNLEIEDTISNPGLAMFFDALSNQSLTPVAPVDTTFNPNPETSKSYTVVKKPMLCKYVRTWGQDNPFNALCPPIGNYMTACQPTGCTPLAIAQIMTFFEWPKTHNGHTYNWATMKNGNANQAAVLIKDLRDDLKTVYHGLTVGSGTNAANIGPSFYNFGYSNCGSGTAYSHGILKYLDSSNSFAKPILIGGSCGSSSHTWVVDGYMCRVTDASENSTGQTIYTYYLHCVWGSYGSGNGYYLVSNKIGGHRHDQDEDDIPYVGHDDKDNTTIYDSLVYWYTYSPRK